MSDRIAVMNAGRIEQIGDPADIYERPATRFVAEFIGRMNLFAGRGDAGARRCAPREGWSIAVPVPAEIATGAAVHVAVRPERARLSRDKPADGLALPGTVRQVLYLGATREFHVDLDGGERGLVETPNDGQRAFRFDAGDAGVARGVVRELPRAAARDPSRRRRSSDERRRRTEHFALRHDRHFAFERRALHQALIFRVVERRRAVLRAAVVPQQRVADAPLVAIDEFRPGREILQVVDQLLRLVVRHAVDLVRPAADVERVQPDCGCRRAIGCQTSGRAFFCSSVSGGRCG